MIGDLVEYMLVKIGIDELEEDLVKKKKKNWRFRLEDMMSCN